MRCVFQHVLQMFRSLWTGRFHPRGHLAKIYDCISSTPRAWDPSWCRANPHCVISCTRQRTREPFEVTSALRRHLMHKWNSVHWGQRTCGTGICFCSDRRARQHNSEHLLSTNRHSVSPRRWTPPLSRHFAARGVCRTEFKHQTRKPLISVSGAAIHDDWRLSALHVEKEQGAASPWRTRETRAFAVRSHKTSCQIHLRRLRIDKCRNYVKSLFPSLIPRFSLLLGPTRGGGTFCGCLPLSQIRIPFEFRKRS